MPTTIVRMPQLGESIAEGTIGRWLKKPGDRVERDEPLLEVQTDKVNAEIPSPVAGVVQQLLQPEGATVAVQTDLVIIGDGPAEQAAASAPPARQAAETAVGPDTSPRAQGPEGVKSHRTPQEAAAASPGPVAGPPVVSFTYDDTPGGGPTSSARLAAEAAGDGSGEMVGEAARRFYTPVVLRMAEEHRLDLSTIQGTGLGGRVTRKDVERAIAEGKPAGRAAPAPVAPPVPAAPPTLPEPVQAAEARRLTPMRRAIAQHMARSRAEIPDAWAMIEVDVTSLVRQRDALQAAWQAREGFELTYLPFFLKAVVAGLRAVPELNATWQGDGVAVHSQYHLGIAVSVQDGLVVPVLRDADQYSVAGLARALRQLVQKARAGKLSPDDLQGATFTANNPGSLGSILSQPIIPVGQAGIVTMEAIVRRPVVTADDAIAVRSMMNCCLSFDHRILDGAQALKFLRTLKEQLETAAYPLY